MVNPLTTGGICVYAFGEIDILNGMAKFDFCL